MAYGCGCISDVRGCRWRSCCVFWRTHVWPASAISPENQNGANSEQYAKPIRVVGRCVLYVNVLMLLLLRH